MQESPLHEFEEILRRLVADGRVSEPELAALQAWLEGRPDLLRRWPFRDLAQMAARFLEDGVVDRSEELEFLAFADAYGLGVSGVATVIADHRPKSGEPLRLLSGDRVTVGRADDEFPEWRLCRVDRSRRGWIHESFIDITAGIGVLRNDYDATELTVNEGDVVTTYHETGRWTWCRDHRGACEWIPSSALEMRR